MVKISFLILCILATTCGGYGDDAYEGVGESSAFKAVKSAIQSSCGGCHNGSNHPLNLLVEKNFHQDKVKNKITNDLMPPPPKTISAETKQQLLAYFAAVAQQPSGNNRNPY